jgi:uncharacterized phage protein gp47/JayE
MPWTTPTLRDVRTMVRDYVRGSLPGADASTPNSVLRVMSDGQSGLAHLNLQYLDWLALQLLPDTAETEWLDRHGTIWLRNSDGTRGRKLATLATGVVMVTGQIGVVVPQGSTLVSSAALDGTQQTYETLEQIIIESSGSPVHVRALDPGSAGNQGNGRIISFEPVVNGVDRAATVQPGIDGGADTETDDDLRFRVLQRIQQPPMGGDKTDYEAWVLQVPGVTRSWCNPLEMGIGTVTVRFMMDDLRADNGGIPLAEDVLAVEAYLDTTRPVAVKDFFVAAPIPFPINLHIDALTDDNGSTRAAIEQSLRTMFFERAIPGETIYHSWVDSAISDANGVDHYELNFLTRPMPTPGHLGILGSIIYAGG